MFGLSDDQLNSLTKLGDKTVDTTENMLRQEVGIPVVRRPYRATLTKDSTPQNVYDHLKNATQCGNFPSMGKHTDGHPMCVYRNPEGMACAAGIFIPDDKYDKSMESRTLDMLINDKTLDKDMFPDFLIKENLLRSSLLRRIQAVHDSIAFVRNEDLTYKSFDGEKFLTEVKRLFVQYGHEVI